MTRRIVSVPELGLIAGTRVMVGAGIGLLLADQLKPEQKRIIGWTLLAIGLLSTIPLAADVLSHHELSDRNGQKQGDGASSYENQMASSRSLTHFVYTSAEIEPKAPVGLEYQEYD